jgi:hypothetical protein
VKNGGVFKIGVCPRFIVGTPKRKQCTVNVFDGSGTKSLFCLIKSQEITRQRRTIFLFVFRPGPTLKEKKMAFTSSQIKSDSTAQDELRFKNSVSSEKEMQQLAQQAAEDALWRIAQNNAMAKVKGMAKLAEAANQLS